MAKFDFYAITLQSASDIRKVAENFDKIEQLALTEDTLPPLDYDPKGSAAAVQANLGTHTADTGLHVTGLKQAAWDTGAQTAADALAIANTKAVAATYTTTISTTWAGTGPYTQTISVPGITAAMVPIVDVVLSDIADTARQQIEAWGMVSRIVTGAGSISVTCLDDKPETAIPIQLKVVQ